MTTAGMNAGLGWKRVEGRLSAVVHRDRGRRGEGEDGGGDKGLRSIGTAEAGMSEGGTHRESSRRSSFCLSCRRLLFPKRWNGNGGLNIQLTDPRVGYKYEAR